MVNEVQVLLALDSREGTSKDDPPPPPSGANPVAVEVSLRQCSSGRELRFKDRVWGRARVDRRGRNQTELLGGEATVYP